MRINLWLKYCIYILALSIVIFSKEYVTGKLEFYYKSTWGADGSYLLLTTVLFAFNLVIGIFLGLGHFIGETKKNGKWKINFPKIVLVGLPSLFFSLTYHIACINIPYVQSILLRYTKLGMNFVPVFQIIAGYVVITCLYKYCGISEDVEQD